MSILEDAQKLKQDIAKTMGLPGIAIDMLRGETKEEIEEDAKRLAKWMGADPEPMDVNKMTPAEIRQNAPELWKKEVERWKTQ